MICTGDTPWPGPTMPLPCDRPGLPLALSGMSSCFISYCFNCSSGTSKKCPSWLRTIAIFTSPSQTARKNPFRETVSPPSLRPEPCRPEAGGTLSQRWPSHLLLQRALDLLDFVEVLRHVRVDRFGVLARDVAVADVVEIARRAAEVADAFGFASETAHVPRVLLVQFLAHRADVLEIEVFVDIAEPVLGHVRAAGENFGFVIDRAVRPAGLAFQFPAAQRRLVEPAF